MRRTKSEIEEIAATTINRVLADLMQEFPKVAAAIHKTDAYDWATWLDEQKESLTEALLNKFDSVD